MKQRVASISKHNEVLKPETRDSSSPWKAVLDLILQAVIGILWTTTLVIHSILRASRNKSFKNNGSNKGVAKGRRVLVTTGRMAKTLHIVRALKEVGAEVVVADYQGISTSRASVACDSFVQLPPLSSNLEDWVEKFADIIRIEKIDMVLPVSTINEALFIGAAKDKLSTRFPNLEWMSDGLERVIQIDDRLRFNDVCRMYNVPCPESGRLYSRSHINGKDIPLSEFDVIFKRVESSTHRHEEIVQVQKGDDVPTRINPSKLNPWQWQRFIHGKELSAWYICKNGAILMSAAYHSKPDLLDLDGIPIPEDVNSALEKLVKSLHLTGQYAFDVIRETKTGKFFVIECNPRASSILETVSTTPQWGEAFFGVDVRPRTRIQHAGFAFHRNCWPWASRKEAIFSVYDPLPFMVSELIWPLELIRAKGLSGFHHLDVNIGKIIVDGPSAPRNLKKFEDTLQLATLARLENAVKYVDTLIVDCKIPCLRQICGVAESHSCRLHIVALKGCEYVENHLTEVKRVLKNFPQARLHVEVSQKGLRTLIGTDTKKARILLDSKTASALQFSCEASSLMTNLVLIAPHTGPDDLRKAPVIPLRQIRVLHLVGSCTSTYYEELSRLYGERCLASVKSEHRFEHVATYVHPDGRWSFPPNLDVATVKDSLRIDIGSALAEIEKLNVDIVLPHMFDYQGMTAYRSMFDILKIPLVGCSAEALALSTNKARTKACVAQAGVRVPESTTVRASDDLNQVASSLTYPVVVKPCEEDNSIGVTLVHEESDLIEAVEQALKYGDTVLCEQFIPLGRELRTGAIERANGDIELLPVIEYFLQDKNPVRSSADKLVTNKNGIPVGMTACKRECPAKIDDALRAKLHRMAALSHRATGCRYYSIYDVRVAPDGEPYFIEQSLYCSFAPSSVLNLLAEQAKMKHPYLFVEFCERAASYKPSSAADKTQLFGMKANK